LNTRPLTYLYGDNEGPSHVVTPVDLYGHRIVTTPNNQKFKVTSTAKSLTKRAKYQWHILNNYTRQWRKDYLLSLQKWKGINKPSNTREVKEGDVVILKEDGTLRCLWKLAHVVEAYKGRNGAIRSARVKLLWGDRILSLRRPMQHLIPLEASD